MAIPCKRPATQQRARQRGQNVLVILLRPLSLLFDFRRDGDHAEMVFVKTRPGFQSSRVRVRSMPANLAMPNKRSM